MKTAALTLTAFAAFVAAQDISSVPECGRFCANDMLNNKAIEIGCEANDLECLCQSTDFVYGLRDCSTATCGEEEARRVVEFGVQVCAGAGVEITDGPGASATGGSSSGSSTATGTGGNGGAGGLVSTITSDGSTIVTTISTATSGDITASLSSALGSVTSSLGSEASSAIGSVTSGLGSLTSGLGSLTSSLASEATGESSSTEGGENTSTEGGEGEATSTEGEDAAFPRATAAPAGILAAVGIAAILL